MHNSLSINFRYPMNQIGRQVLQCIKRGRCLLINQDVIYPCAFAAPQGMRVASQVFQFVIPSTARKDEHENRGRCVLHVS
jgi:hypothetical protein